MLPHYTKETSGSLLSQGLVLRKKKKNSSTGFLKGFYLRVKIENRRTN